jgi:hypothetical protein
MADPPRSPDSDRDSGDDADLRPGGDAPPGTPRWVKVLGIMALAAVLLVVLLLLVGGHTPPMQHGQ